MNPITLPMSELKPALTGLGKLIQKSHGLPVLKTIKIERTAEGWIALTATDLDAFATVRLEQPVEGEPFAMLVPHEELARTRLPAMHTGQIPGVTPEAWAKARKHRPDSKAAA